MDLRDQGRDQAGSLQVDLKEQGQLRHQDELHVCCGTCFCLKTHLFSKTQKVDGGPDVYTYKRSFKAPQAQSPGTRGSTWHSFFPGLLWLNLGSTGLRSGPSRLESRRLLSQ